MDHIYPDFLVYNNYGNSVVSEPVEETQAAGDGPEFSNIAFGRIGVPVHRHSEIRIKPEPAGSSR
jgi:hypothetical protein